MYLVRHYLFSNYFRSAVIVESPQEITEYKSSVEIINDESIENEETIQAAESYQSETGSIYENDHVESKLNDVDMYPDFSIQSDTNENEKINGHMSLKSLDEPPNQDVVEPIDDIIDTASSFISIRNHEFLKKVDEPISSKHDNVEPDEVCRGRPNRMICY